MKNIKEGIDDQGKKFYSSYDCPQCGGPTEEKYWLEHYCYNCKKWFKHPYAKGLNY
jgi:hypothetical protein